MNFEIIKHGKAFKKTPILHCSRCECIVEIEIEENEQPHYSIFCPECGYAGEVEYVTKEELENMKMDKMRMDC